MKFKQEIEWTSIDAGEVPEDRYLEVLVMGFGGNYYIDQLQYYNSEWRNTSGGVSQRLAFLAWAEIDAETLAREFEE
jgi:hypothetical protein